MKIAIAGGTGTVGRLAADAARAAGHDVVIVARSAGVDVVTGEGLADALGGVDAVIDALNIPTLNGDAATAYFEATTTRLLAAERDAGVQHHVLLSIVNCERAPYGYYAGKVAQERIVETGRVPWTILRTAQFHEFAAQMYGRAKLGPLHTAPRMRTQPVAAREVAARLVELAAAPPAGRARDLAGPQEENLAEMVRSYARAIGARGWMPAIPLPGAFGRAQRDGTLLPSRDADSGRQTFAEWVAAVRPAATR